MLHSWDVIFSIQLHLTHNLGMAFMKKGHLMYRMVVPSEKRWARNGGGGRRKKKL